MRPYIICHMLTSIDGKVTGKFLLDEKINSAIEHYYEINRKLKCDGFICGRVTMEESFTNHQKIDLSKFTMEKVEKVDYVSKKHDFYAIAFDRFGKLGWKEPFIKDNDIGYDNAHIIEVLTEKVSDAYLSYLKSIGVSYIFAGKEDIDIKLALKKLFELFNIKKLLLEGGSIINGAFAKVNLIDELSLVVAPITGKKEDYPLFYDSNIEKFKLYEACKLKDNVVYLSYKKE